MKNVKKVIASSLLSASLILSATLAPVKKAEAGAIVMAAGSTVVALPAGLALAGMFGGFGSVIFSIYWAIDHRDKSWYALGLFLLDEHINNNEVSSIIAARYPELDSFVVDEVSELIVKHSANVKMTQNGYKEVIIPESELQDVLAIVADAQPELAAQLLKDLTKKLN